MDSFKPNRFRTRQFLTPKAERYLGIQPHAPSPLVNSTPLELTEDDVVFSYESSQPSSSSSSSNRTPNRHYRHQYNHHQYHHRKASPLGPPDSFGILASLPEGDESPNVENTSQFLNNAPVSVSVSGSVSSNSSSSSTRPVLVVQRPQTEGTPSWSSPASNRFYHSAPVNVPMMSPEMVELARKYEEEDALAAVDEDEFRVPPHEYISRQLEFSSMHSCSLFEGVGRTLKGRDMRSVRNAVLSQTGFIS
ncbi:uncharacterized protein [Cicer arietinum]|uniref:Uncharacterized protein LOC101502592 n=1 Tax=Cicer arietinum TaxID=3827 RepID=A0A1S2XD47_CICAR|nr:uncharacterized protein LOC101502592 [Cicer arietinum]